MTYAIIGSGAIGTALATQFARNNIDVLVTNSRGAAAVSELVDKLCNNIKPVSVKDATLWVAEVDRGVRPCVDVIVVRTDGRGSPVAGRACAN